jgi:hypothetical protein
LSDARRKFRFGSLASLVKRARMNPADSAETERAEVRENYYDNPMHPVQIAGFRKMSIAQKFDLITMMRETGIGLRIAGLRMRHPDWSEEKLETEARRAALHASTD